MTKLRDKSRKNPLLKAVPNVDAPSAASEQDRAGRADLPLFQDPVNNSLAPEQDTDTLQDETQTPPKRAIFSEHLMLSTNTGLSGDKMDRAEGEESTNVTPITPTPIMAAQIGAPTSADAERKPVAPAPLGRHGGMPLPPAPRAGGWSATKLQRAPARPNSSGAPSGSTPAAVAGQTQAAGVVQPMRNVAENPSRNIAGAGSAQRPMQPTGPKEPAPAISGKPIAVAAELRARHYGILASFVAMVLLPVVVVASYLWVFAVDQYASTVGFSVRTEEMSSSLGLLGGITRLSGGGSSDSDILYDYIHSQELVMELDAQIDLRSIYAQAWPGDPVFALDPDSSIEDLVDHWRRVVQITYDTGSGLITLRVLAFDPAQATLIASKIVEQSTQKINALSDDAREDATRYARLEMERALERLKLAREAMTGFRMRTQMVDPLADLQGQMGILNNLQASLAESYIELDLLRVTTNTTDPRIVQVEQRIAVIQNRMEEERRKFSESSQGPRGEDYATLVAEFERLSVDREFAEQSYRVALAAYDSALAEAQRKSRYLATHIRPTLSEESKFPQRWTLLGLAAFFVLMVWAIGLLILYSIRDRR